MSDTPITPANDPELIWVIEQLKQYKDRKFFGTVSLHMEHGIVLRLTTEESKKVPVALTGPQLPKR